MHVRWRTWIWCAQGRHRYSGTHMNTYYIPSISWTRTMQGRAQLYARVFSWIPKFSSKKTYTYSVCVYIYIYILKKERNKSTWIVCEEFSPKTLLLPPSVLTRWPNSSIRPNTACISLSPHQMAQQPNTIQIMLIYAQLCVTYLLYIMLH
jgi:hypothetical protein